jgi:hypothetical protein
MEIKILARNNESKKLYIKSSNQLTNARNKSAPPPYIMTMETLFEINGRRIV